MRSSHYSPIDLGSFGRIAAWAIRVPYIGGTSNAYVLKSDSVVIVVDPGHPIGLGRFESQLAALALRPRDIDAFVYTHAHVDHFGNGALLDSPRAVHFAGHATARLLYEYGQWRGEKIAGVAILADMFPAQAGEFTSLSMRRFLEGFFPVLPDMPQLHGTDRLQMGDIALDLLAAPGHSPDHVVVNAAKEQVLMSGDYVFRDGHISIGYHAGGSIEHYRDSLHTLSDLQPCIVLPGHGPALSDWSRLLHQAEGRIDAELRSALRVAKVSDPLGSFFGHRLREVGVYAAANRLAAYWAHLEVEGDREE